MNRRRFGTSLYAGVLFTVLVAVHGAVVWGFRRIVRGSHPRYAD